jgi:hypothetical protein
MNAGRRALGPAGGVIQLNHPGDGDRSDVARSGVSAGDGTLRWTTFCETIDAMDDRGAHDELVRALIAEARQLFSDQVNPKDAVVSLAELAWTDVEALFDADRALVLETEPAADRAGVASLLKGAVDYYFDVQQGRRRQPSEDVPQEDEPQEKDVRPEWHGFTI